MARKFTQTSHSSSDSDDDMRNLIHPVNNRTRHPAQQSQRGIVNENYSDMSVSLSPSAPTLHQLQTPRVARKAPALPHESFNRARANLRDINCPTPNYPLARPRTNIARRQASSQPTLSHTKHEVLTQQNPNRSISPIPESPQELLTDTQPEDEILTQFNTTRPKPETHFPQTENLVLEYLPILLNNPSYIVLESGSPTMCVPQLKIDIKQLNIGTQADPNDIREILVRSMYAPFLKSNTHSFIQRQFYQELFPSDHTFTLRLGQIGRRQQKQAFTLAICELEFRTQSLTGKWIHFTETLFIIETDILSPYLVFGRDVFRDNFAVVKRTDHGIVVYQTTDLTKGHYIRFDKPIKKKPLASTAPPIKRTQTVRRNKHDLKIFIPPKPSHHFPLNTTHSSLNTSKETPTELLSPDTLILNRERSHTVTQSIIPSIRSRSLPRPIASSSPTATETSVPRSVDTENIAPVHRNRLSLGARRKKNQLPLLPKIATIPKINFFRTFTQSKPKQPICTDLREHPHSPAPLETNTNGKTCIHNESRNKFDYRKTQFAVSKPSAFELTTNRTPATQSSSLDSDHEPITSQIAQGFSSDDEYDLHYFTSPTDQQSQKPQTPSPCLWCQTTFNTAREKIWHVPQCARFRYT